MSFKRSAVVAVFCAISANAHLFISTPKPISGNAIKDPLEKDGSNFPCHGVPLPGSGGQPMAVGAEQKLAFDLGMPATIAGSPFVGGANTAVHGGGSCQLSITYETDPAKVKQASAWKVIHSIEGGCPTNSHGNLLGPFHGPKGDYSGVFPCDSEYSNGLDCVPTFNYSIPTGVKNGQATLAWTWFNTVGNREMYMNCAAIDITGGASDDSGMSDLPNMFTANIGGAQTDENTDVKFPQAGKYVVNAALASATYMSGGAVQTVSNAAPFPLAIPSAFAQAGSGGSESSSPPAYSATSSVAVPTVAVPTTSTTLPIATSAVPMPSVPADAPPSAANTTSGGCGSGEVSCPTPGNLICVDETHFGLCDIDHCAIVQSVAAGTSCKNGSIGHSNMKRSSRINRHIAAHVHKRY